MAWWTTTDMTFCHLSACSFRRDSSNFFLEAWWSNKNLRVGSKSKLCLRSAFDSFQQQIFYAQTVVSLDYYLSKRRVFITHQRTARKAFSVDMQIFSVIHIITDKEFGRVSLFGGPEMHHNKKVFEDLSDGQWWGTQEYLFQCPLKLTFAKVARQHGAFKKDLETVFLLGGVALVGVSLALTLTSHLYLYPVGCSPANYQAMNPQPHVIHQAKGWRFVGALTKGGT